MIKNLKKIIPKHVEISSKIKIFLLLLFCITLPVIPSSAQSEKELKKAEKYFLEKDYIGALKEYEAILEKKPTHPVANMKIAQCYLLSSRKTKSFQYAHDAIKNSQKPTSEMLYTYAEANQIIHNFDTAARYYTLSDPGNKNKRIISKKIAECSNGKKYLTSPLPVKITNAGPVINTEHQEYLPYITADGMALYFTSRRPGSVGGKKDNDGRPFEDIYRSFNKGGAWDHPENIGSPLNSDIHDACVGLAPDGQIMFVYKGSNGGDLYLSNLKGSRWTAAAPLSALNTEFFESTACLSPDGRTMYFVRKSLGSRDIYVCNKTSEGNWSKPKKLDVINSEFDEDSPFMHPDGKTLYFSSKGHSTMGGYDIFKSTKTTAGTWSTPENVGYPINTASDEVYFVLTADGKIGYYSSDKEGGLGQQDIYSIRMPASLSPQLALLKGKVKDEVSGKAVEAQIIVTDNQTKEVVAKFNSNKETGEYLLPLPSGRNYGIAIETEGHLFYSENIFLTEAEGFKEIKKDISLVSARPGVKVVLKNIFFDSGKADLKPESTSELLRLVNVLKQNPLLKIEISGHTDNIGDEEANRKLSEVRAKTVAAFLISNGIQALRITAKGYGSSDPVKSNDTPEGRQINRRTEFKVL